MEGKEAPAPVQQGVSFGILLFHIDLCCVLSRFVTTIAIAVWEVKPAHLLVRTSHVELLALNGTSRVCPMP